MASRTSFAGFDIFLLSLIGWSLTSTKSPKKKSFSLQQIQQIKLQIVSQLTAQAPLGPGLSKRQALYWLAVSSFETAQFTSTLCAQYNNFFGMKWSGRSPAIDLNGSKWAFPDSLQSSVALQIDYINRMSYPKDFPDLATFCQFMKTKGYFQESYSDYYPGLLANLNLIAS
jgi:hypothetical protein